MPIKQISIIGVGLIGGSFAKGLKARKHKAKIFGFGYSEHKLNRAIELGVIDEFSLNIKEAVKNADLIMVAIPMGSFKKVFQQIKPFIKQDAIISDAGSSKMSVIKAAEDVFGKKFTNFVPAHPIAGKEKSGIEATDENLYEQHKVILTPTKITDIKAVEKVTNLWQLLGATVIEMLPQEHDEVLAASSHLPHILAFALVDLLAKQKDLPNVFDFTSGGFKDFSRIASSDPTMWRDITLNNSTAIIKWLKNYQTELTKITTMVEQNKENELFQLFNHAKKTRDKHVLKKEKAKP